MAEAAILYQGCRNTKGNQIHIKCENSVWSKHANA
jgi:hypothetical protein